jgi:uncharacterized small protein (DUF1192 family)
LVALLTAQSRWSTIPPVDADEPRARPDDLLTNLVRQDLDPLSLAELDARVDVLRAEIERVQAHRQRATLHKVSAESLFKS